MKFWESAISDTSTQQSTQSVLVIDDSVFALDVFKELLAQLDVKNVHSAPDGMAAKRLLASMPTQPDFLICDLFMPNMDGIEFLDLLAKQGYSGGVLIVTGVDTEMLRLTSFIASSAGLNILGTLEKPVSLEQLSSVMGLPVVS